MINYTHADSYWRFYTSKSGRMNVALYLKMLEVFCETGEVAGRGEVWPEGKPWLDYDDPLLKFLTQAMSRPEVKMRVLSSRLCAKIFYATMGKFIVEAINHRKFSIQRQWSERKQVGDASVMDFDPNDDRNWQMLLEEIDAKHKQDGFDKEFHQHQFAENQRGRFAPDNDHNSEEDKKKKWAKMIDDWAKALDEQVKREDQNFIERNSSHLGTKLDKLLDDARSYLERNNVDEEKAVQAWKQMDGHWSTTEFKRHMKLVNIQDAHPQIKQVVALMGRQPSQNGRDRLSISYEKGLKIDHSSGSDIDGITVGRNLHALLPSEMAMYMDDELEDVFMYKYMRQRLQTFRYRSNMVKPVRKLSGQTAVRRGPMIVCVDTSASMLGVPQRIIKSSLSLIEDLAERLNRNCYLIDFSVSVRAIDLRLRMRYRGYEQIGYRPDDGKFEQGGLPFIGGGTDAQSMMGLMFKLLNNDANYINADVLWISDFLIPLPPRSYLERMKACQQTGTKFYAMEVLPEGSNESKWKQLFDKMFRVSYKMVRRY